VVAAPVVGQRYVRSGLGSDQAGRHPQVPEFGGPETLGDLRTGARGATAVEHSGTRTAACDVGVVLPPQHRLAAGLVQGRSTAGEREAEVERRLPCGDVVVNAFYHGASGFVLVEAELDEGH